METITIETVVSLFKNANEKKRMRDIKKEIIAALYPDSLLIDPELQEEVEHNVERIIREDLKSGSDSFLTRDSGGKYRKRRNRRTPNGDSDVDSIYIGKAGECAVISELMFRGYNANTMLLDEGIDVVAVKNNIYYYIQVKTTHIRDGRIYARIKKDRFEKYIESQIRYIIVGRYEKGGDNVNIFFVFSPGDIELLKYHQCINESEDFLNIKIEFEARTGKYYMYDGNKRFDVSFYINKFL
ncbi:MAG: hypothetical protein IJ680_08200 [Paludibacteraceae bacterium]|nr:hypothetical protein [Paludibacteraceae bacterium]